MGAELGFALAALVGGAAGGGFAGYLAALTLSLRPGGVATGPA